MKSPIFAQGSLGSKRYSLRRTRTFIARTLLRCGHRLADWAEWIAPWLEENRDDARVGERK